MRVIACVFLVACGTVKDPGTDATPGGDAPGGPTFTGSVEQLVQGVRHPLANAQVTLARDDGTQVGTTATDANGAFSIPVTGALPLDGFYKVEGGAILTSFLHLVTPASTDPVSHIVAFSASELDRLAATAGTAQQPGASLVIAETIRNGSALSNATVHASPPGGGELPVCYSDSTGAPSCALGATSADGLGWLFSVPAGSIIVNGKDSAGTQLPGPTFEVLANTVVFTPVR
jgi:hypothetical protein